MRRTLLIAASALALSLPLAAQADGVAGPYLAGRQALSDSDFAAASRYYQRLVRAAPNRGEHLERAVMAHFAMGRTIRAASYARRIEAGNHSPSQIGQLVIAAEMGANGEFDALLQRLDSGRGAGPISTDLLRGWTLLGAGDLAAAEAAYDLLAQGNTMRPFALYHKALVRSVAGDTIGALEALQDPGIGALSRTLRALRLRAELFAAAGDTEAARILLRPYLDQPEPDPDLVALDEAIASGAPLPKAEITTVSDGMAEVFLTLSEALRTEGEPDFLLLYIRAALHLRPDWSPALLFGAELLEELGQYDLAVATYRRVPESDPVFAEAEIGRANALRQLGQDDAAIEVLQALAARRSTLPDVHSALGDNLRRSERYAEAIQAYDAALALVNPDAAEAWFLHYVRGITYERTDQWDLAEADFRRALELNPGQPQVLNYLGYSLVQKQIKLDEALSMIETAVAASPDSGYIVDSLAWVLFRLGRYEEALPHMIRAAELMPIDPIVSDHLGDVLWANGRTREAEFQWMRALSFVGYGTAAEEVQVDRIRRKLDIGLDAVLAEEGEPPLRMADDK